MLQTVFFHHQALDACETILSNEQGINNVLLVGEQGVGVSTIVYKLAERFLLDKSLPSLNPKRVIMLNLSLIFSQDVTGNTKDKARVILEAICKEVINAGNIVLVIDRFQDYVCTKDNAALISVLDVLSSYLPLPNFQLILIVDHQGLANIVGFYPYLLNLVEKVEVREPAIEEVYRVIEGKIFYLERKYNEFITYPAIRVIIECSGKYIPEKVFPKKATDLLTQVVADVAKKRKKRIIFPQDVYAVISDKIGFQVGPLGLGEKEKLINLEEMLHQGIVAQDQAIQEISNTLRRARAEIAIRKGPMGAFLFLGPTGVGKTETTKVLANIYFGSKEKILRFDMAEYQNPEDIVRLIGSETTSGYLATKVRENPFSLVLLDEIEKAHYSILDLFLTILDEGYFTTPLGNKKISFINTLIIATSNFGYKIILNSFKQKREKNIEIDLDKLKKEIIDDSFAQAIFKPEFINRFDGVILFHPLDKNHLFQISGLLFDSLKKNLAEKDIELIVTDEIRNKIIELGYNIIYGAREMRRVIQERVENPISMSLLRGEIEKGDRIEIDPRDFRVIKR
jgi:ATP-dependent Clp protease ATP-binding subunit ClpC